MRIHIPGIPDPSRRLVPFILFSLLLHVALLFVIRPPAKYFSIAQPHPMEVFLSAAAVSEQAGIPIKVPTGQRGKPSRLLTSLQDTTKIQAAQPAAQPDATSHSDTSRMLTPQQLMESAKNMARDEARKTEQHIAALEKKRLDSPVGLLEQYLRQPHKEIRLANGMLKIITDAGAVCFQPVPYFAHDSAGVYGIPTTCP